MGDNVQDVSDVSDSESVDLERPPTPEIHDEDNSQDFDETLSEFEQNDEDNIERESKNRDENPETVQEASSPVSNKESVSDNDEKENEGEEPVEMSDSETNEDVVNKPEELQERVSDDEGEDIKDTSEESSSSNKETQNSESLENSEVGTNEKVLNVENDIELEENLNKDGLKEDDKEIDKDEQNSSSEDNIENEKDKEKEEDNDVFDSEAPISPLSEVLGADDISGPDAAIINDIMTGVDNDDPFDDPLEFSGELEDIEEQNNEETSRLSMEEAGPSQAEDTEEHPSEAVGELIDEIFGSSDEDEEFEGFGHEDVEISKKKRKDLVRERRSTGIISDEEEEEDYNEHENDDVDKTVDEAVASLTVPPPPPEERDSDDEADDRPSSFESDFDRMIEKRKELNKTKRRRMKDSEFIGDNDDIIEAMIKKMHEAVEEDKIANEAKQAATKKLKMLPIVLAHLNKSDLQCALLDSGILGSLKEWLSALPDGSLPHLQIRSGILKALAQFPSLDAGRLKSSGIGKAVMYLYRHPREIRENKEIAGKLINDWARPIFGVTSNFKSLSREEREERDYQNMSKRRRLSSGASDGGKTPKSIDKALQGEQKAKRPGDKGWIGRARVPMPSNKDYVVRPKWNNDTLDFSRGVAKKAMNRFEKQKRKFKDRNPGTGKGAQRAVAISIEGRKMSL